MSASRRRVAALGVAALCVSATAATAAEWLRVEADGFTFIGDVSERRLTDIASDLRLFRYTIGRYITTTPSGDAMPVQVLAVSHDTWEKQLRPREGLAGMFVAGPFAGDILVDADRGWQVARVIVYHEFTHHYIHNLDKFPYPAWFHEGLAQFLSTAMKDGGRVIVGRMPYGNWLNTDAQSWLPMPKLLAIDHQSPEYRDHSGANQFYLQSWLFMHYLLVGNQPLREGINTLLAQMVRGADGGAALQAAFGKSGEQLDAELKAYYRRQQFQVIPIPAPKGLEKVKVRASVIPEAEALRALGLAALRSRPDSLERVVPIFSALVRTDATDATAMAGLGMALEGGGKEEDARRWMRAVHKAPGADSTALELCGDFFAARAGSGHDDGESSDLSMARQCYRRSLEVDPSNHEALVGLATLEEELDATESAALVDALEQALVTYPQSEFLTYALAKTYFHAGDHDKAGRTLVRAVNATRDPAMRRQMATLLLTMRAAKEP